MLEISLFGSFDVRRDGEPLCAHWRRHADRLLALLTLHHDRPVRTDWILVALGLAESVLPQSLGELYELLGEERERIRNANRQVYFDTRGVRVDVFEFRKQIARDTPEALEQAVALHRGGLLADREEEAWFAEERESCLTDYIHAVNTLAKAALQAGDVDCAASYLRRYVNAYPEMDAAWGRLIALYGTAGSATEVEKTFRRYRAALQARSQEEERDLAPSRFVVQAYEVALRSATASAPTAGPLPVLSADEDSAQADRAAAVEEPAGGAVPLDSRYYLARPADALVFEAVGRQDSFVLIKGPRQVGKSSLLARVFQRARDSGAQVVRTDWQKISQAALETDASFLLELADTFVDQLDLSGNPLPHFAPERAATKSFERFLRRDVLPAVPGSLVWIIDEADRLFECGFRDDIFALLRSWHGERANDLTGGWRRLTVVMAYATEAYLFIANLSQSPFNVGSRFDLDDFTREQVEEMNRRYGSPLAEEAEVDRLYALVGGHPYLVRRCLQEMILRRQSLADVTHSLASGSGPFADHLGRMGTALQRDPEMAEALRGLLREGRPPGFAQFLRLSVAGVVRGGSPDSLRLRCRLYESYLRKVLL